MSHLASKLEQTIVERAREHLKAVKAFYALNGNSDEDSRDDYRRDHAQLYALLEFGHLSGCGMSPEGRAALLAVEADCATALRERFPPISRELNIEGDKAIQLAALGGGTVGALSIFIELFGNEDAAPKLTEFFVSTYADKRGETPTEAQRVEIKNAVEAMVQFPPSNRTPNNFIALLRDSDVIFSCASALRDSEAVAHYLQS